MSPKRGPTLQDKVHELTAGNDDIANLLVSAEVATVFIDTDLRIERFTAAASHVLNLQKSDLNELTYVIRLPPRGLSGSGRSERRSCAWSRERRAQLLAQSAGAAVT